MSGAASSLKSRLRDVPVLQGASSDDNFAQLGTTPHEAFEHWLNEAIEAGVKEPHAMTLSTVDDMGFPDARVLILKNVDSRGWHFAVKSSTPKGRHIAQNPHVALTFYWPEICRQIRIRGVATQLPEPECREDFSQRPQGSKISAMASKQSEILADVEDLTQSLENAKNILDQRPNSVVADWAVYAVEPVTVEFWQGQKSRQHRRLQYVYQDFDKSWTKQRLWP